MSRMVRLLLAVVALCSIGLAAVPAKAVAPPIAVTTAVRDGVTLNASVLLADGSAVLLPGSALLAVPALAMFDTAGAPSSTTSLSTDVWDAVIGSYTTITTTFDDRLDEDQRREVSRKHRATVLDALTDAKREAKDAGVDYDATRAAYDKAHGRK